MDLRNNFIKCIKSTYRSKTTPIIIKGELTKASETQKGRTQGCPLSPLLFIILALKSLNRDIKLNERITFLLKEETRK